MLILITYDVSTVDSAGKTRLRQIAKACQNFGQRVQNSVFEINTDYGTVVKLKAKIIDIMDKEKDSLRFYHLGNKWETKVEHYGTKKSYNPEGALIL
ncbi:MAG TPA: CRISPR-associated endonuclease Cas2 [Clostridia bacterium]|nr:CRISPR-associated endonuclease Cas2 [Clostridia bacterium]